MLSIPEAFALLTSAFIRIIAKKIIINMHKDLDHSMFTLATRQSKSGRAEKSLMPAIENKRPVKQSHVKPDCTQLKSQRFENYF